MKESYLTLDFRTTVAKRFPAEAERLNAAFDARLGALRAEYAGAGKEKLMHLERQIMPGIAAYETFQTVMDKDEALRTVHGYVEQRAQGEKKNNLRLLRMPLTPAARRTEDRDLTRSFSPVPRGKALTDRGRAGGYRQRAGPRFQRREPPPVRLQVQGRHQADLHADLLVRPVKPKSAAQERVPERRFSVFSSTIRRGRPGPRRASLRSAPFPRPDQAASRLCRPRRKTPRRG